MWEIWSSRRRRPSSTCSTISRSVGSSNRCFSTVAMRHGPPPSSGSGSGSAWNM
ncbi:hypothetical protein [Nannocystis pusilla]|uniref:hypothetical protein n=1 Tax=Nannocystis pusilla TaxID=889268 RepID=UPI003B7814D0